MPTVQAAADAICVEPGLIAKTVIFLDAAGNIVTAIASGLDRIDRTLLALAVNLPKLRLADAETVLASTGYPAGGVSPIGHRHPGTVVVDAALAARPTVYAGGGEHELLLAVDVPSLIQITSATIAPITRRPDPPPTPSS